MQGLHLLLIALIASISVSYAFVVPTKGAVRVLQQHSPPSHCLYAEAPAQGDQVVVLQEYGPRKGRKIERLITDDEWVEFAMYIAARVNAVVSNSIDKFKATETADAIKNIDKKAKRAAKIIDARAKREVAKLRGKEDYELGDLVKAMDELAKEEVCKITGKDEYQVGDLTNEITMRVDALARDLTGKDDFTSKDVATAIQSRTKARVEAVKAKGLEKIKDIEKTIEQEREDWIATQFSEEVIDDAKEKLDRFRKHGLSKAISNLGNLFGDLLKKEAAE